MVISSTQQLNQSLFSKFSITWFFSSTFQYLPVGVSTAGISMGLGGSPSAPPVAGSALPGAAAACLRPPAPRWLPGAAVGCRLGTRAPWFLRGSHGFTGKPRGFNKRGVDRSHLGWEIPPRKIGDSIGQSSSHRVKWWMFHGHIWVPEGNQHENREVMELTLW